MRALLALCLLSVPTDAFATRGPCVTPESSERALAAMAPHFRWPTTEAPEMPAVIVLVACDANEARRLRCSLQETPPESPYPIGEAALAFAEELELCPGEPDHVRFAITIAHGE